MGYEYEELVISTVYDLNSEMYPDKEIEIIKNELKEVYAKAKAFDEIKKSIIQIKCNYKGNEERINKFIARETEYIMDTEDE